jgi:hypothetical protein
MWLNDDDDDADWHSVSRTTILRVAGVMDNIWFRIFPLTENKDDM